MFEQATLSNGPASKRALTTFAGVTTQAVIVTGLVLAPMIFPQAMPKMIPSIPSVFSPPPGPGAEVKPAATHIAAVRPRIPFNPRAIFAPSRTPTKIELGDDGPAGAITGPPGIPGGVPGGFDGGIIGGLNMGTAVAPPPLVTVAKPLDPIVKPPVPTVPERIRGGVVNQARIIRRIEPLYPALAKQARISGTVELEGIIGVDGRMIELKVKSGHPLLIKAAYEAVIQWMYQPTTLNGKAVEVIAPITVTFHLN